jgi:hypothetical protein
LCVEWEQLLPRDGLLVSVVVVRRRTISLDAGGWQVSTGRPTDSGEKTNHLTTDRQGAPSVVHTNFQRYPAKKEWAPILRSISRGHHPGLQRGKALDTELEQVHRLASNVSRTSTDYCTNTLFIISDFDVPFFHRVDSN